MSWLLGEVVLIEHHKKAPATCVVLPGYLRGWHVTHAHIYIYIYTHTHIYIYTYILESVTQMDFTSCTPVF